MSIMNSLKSAATNGIITSLYAKSYHNIDGLSIGLTSTVVSTVFAKKKISTFVGGTIGVGIAFALDVRRRKRTLNGAGVISSEFFIGRNNQDEIKNGNKVLTLDEFKEKMLLFKSVNTEPDIFFDDISEDLQEQILTFNQENQIDFQLNVRVEN